MKNLKLLRTSQHLSQQKLGELLNVSQQSIHKYENNITSPDLDTLKAMADYFNTSVDYILGLTQISHKIEPVTETMLNDSEIAFLEMYRKLSSSQKEFVHKLSKEFVSKN